MICDRCITKSLRVSWSEEVRGLHVEVAGSMDDWTTWMGCWPCMSLKRNPHREVSVPSPVHWIVFVSLEDHFIMFMIDPRSKGLLTHRRVPPRRPHTHSPAAGASVNFNFLLRVSVTWEYLLEAMQELNYTAEVKHPGESFNKCGFLSNLRKY